MSLGRAKFIFIIAFAGLNLFLSYHLFWPDYGRFTLGAVTSEDIVSTESFLNSYNYVLDANVGRSKKTGDFITVSHSSSIQNMFIQYYLDNQAVQFESDDINYYRLQEELALVHANGLLQVFYEHGKELFIEPDGYSEDEIRNAVNRFLATINLEFQGIRYDYIDYDDKGKMIVHYYQSVNGVPLYASQLRIVLSDGYIEKIEIYWLDVHRDTQAREKEVMPATEALTSLVKNLGPSLVEKTITQVSLGYFSGEFDAEKWEVPPVWRILVDNSKCYYINAFTGNLEKDSIIPEQVP